MPVVFSALLHALAIAGFIFVKPAPHAPPEAEAWAEIVVDVVEDHPIAELKPTTSAAPAAQVVASTLAPNAIEAPTSQRAAATADIAQPLSAALAAAIEPSARAPHATPAEGASPIAAAPAAPAAALVPAPPAVASAPGRPTAAMPAAASIGTTAITAPAEPARAPEPPAAIASAALDPVSGLDASRPAASGPAAVASEAVAPGPVAIASEAVAPAPATASAIDSRPLVASLSQPKTAEPDIVSRSEPAQLAAVVAPSQPAGRSFDPEGEIEHTLSNLGCARVSAKLDPSSGDLALSGHLRSGEERERLVRQVASIAGVQRVDAGALHLVGEPYCRVLTFLGRKEFSRSQDQRHAVSAIGDPAQAGVARFSAGTALELMLGAPNFDSYVYVDYFSADGQVYHLLPTDTPDNRFAAGERFGLGEKHRRGRPAVIAPPFGLDMVVALASSEPLFARPRPTTENAAAYLQAVDAAIAALRERGSRPQLEYAYHLIYTGPKSASN